MPTYRTFFRLLLLFSFFFSYLFMNVIGKIVCCTLSSTIQTIQILYSSVLNQRRNQIIFIQLIKLTKSKLISRGVLSNCLLRIRLYVSICVYKNIKPHDLLLWIYQVYVEQFANTLAFRISFFMINEFLFRLQERVLQSLKLSTFVR